MSKPVRQTFPRASVVDQFDCGGETGLNRLAVGAYS